MYQFYFDSLTNVEILLVRSSKDVAHLTKRLIPNHTLSQIRAPGRQQGPPEAGHILHGRRQFTQHPSLQDRHAPLPPSRPKCDNTPVHIQPQQQ